MEFFSLFIGFLFGLILTIGAIFFALFKINTFGESSGLRFSGSMLQSKVTSSLNRKFITPSTTMIPIYPLLARFFGDKNGSDVNNSQTGSVNASMRSISPSRSSGVDNVINDYYRTLLQKIETSQGSDVGESAVWLNVLMTSVLRFFTDMLLSMELQSEAMLKTSSSNVDSSRPISSPTPSKTNFNVLLNVINSFLAKAVRPPALGPTRLSHLEIGSVYPVIHEARVVYYRPEAETEIDPAATGSTSTSTSTSSGVPQREPLLMEIDFSVIADSCVEVETSVNIGPKQLPDLAVLPIQAAISSVFFGGRLRFAVDFNVDSPSIACCFTEEPLVNIELATCVGHAMQLVNIPHLQNTILSLLRNNLKQYAVAPQMLTFPILEDQIQAVRSFFNEMVKNAASHTTQQSNLNASTMDASFSKPSASASSSATKMNTSVYGKDHVDADADVDADYDEDEDYDEDVSNLSNISSLSTASTSHGQRRTEKGLFSPSNRISSKPKHSQTKTTSDLDRSKNKYSNYEDDTKEFQNQSNMNTSRYRPMRSKM